MASRRGFVPVAALTAIFAPELLTPKGSLDASLGNARLLAGVLAIAAAWRTKNVLLTIAVGMAGLLILQRGGQIAAWRPKALLGKDIPGADFAFPGGLSALLGKISLR